MYVQTIIIIIIIIIIIVHCIFIYIYDFSRVINTEETIPVGQTRATAFEREVRQKLISLNAAFQGFKDEDEKWKKTTTQYLLALQPSFFNSCSGQ